MDPILKQLHNEIANSLNGLDSAQTQLTPSTATEKWSIQQIVQHLCLTYTFTETAFDARLVKGTPTRARPTLQQRLGQYFLTTLGIFPTGREAPGESPLPKSCPLSVAATLPSTQANILPVSTNSSTRQKLSSAPAAASPI